MAEQSHYEKAKEALSHMLEANTIISEIMMNREEENRKARELAEEVLETVRQSRHKDISENLFYIAEREGMIAYGDEE